MHKSAIATAAVAGTVALGFAAPRVALHDGGFGPETYRLKEERVVLEYTPARDEAVVVLQAESEVGLTRVEVLGPDKSTTLSLRAQQIGGHSISGFNVELAEAPLDQVLATYAEGRYQMRARTETGLGATGNAVLFHGLLDEPQAIYPTEGASGVPTSGLTVRWTPDPEASGYVVILEQGDNDGLTVELPGGTSQLVVPDGLLRPGTPTLFEIGAYSPNGNLTISEVNFTTH